MIKAAQRELATIAGELRTALGSEVANIVRIGALLTEAKKSRHLPYGAWLPWLKSEFSMSERSAQRYMRAHKFSAKYATVADLNLSPTALYLLSDRRADDDSFTPKVIEAILAEAKKNRVGEERCWEIAESMRTEPAEEESEAKTTEQEAEDQGAEEILDGPPPDLPQPGSPEPSPTASSPRDQALIATFKKSIEAFSLLITKPPAKFIGAVEQNDLIKAADFLSAVAKREVAPPTTAEVSLNALVRLDELESEVVRLRRINGALESELEELKTENVELKECIVELKQTRAPTAAAGR